MSASPNKQKIRSHTGADFFSGKVRKPMGSPRRILYARKRNIPSCKPSPLRDNAFDLVF